MSSRVTAGDVSGPARITLGISLKLYLDIDQSVAWARRVATIVRANPDIASGALRMFVLPSVPALPAVRQALQGTGVAVGAQDLHWEDRGAFTGAISGADLAAISCAYVEVGHAERRSVFGEGEEVVRRKARAAVRNGLVPVLCVGEGEHLPPDAAIAVCRAQLADALREVPDDARTEIVVAYEPVWAIGQAEPAPPEHVSAVCAALRESVRVDPRLVSGSVIYGGSAQTGTLTRLGHSVDGLFLGRFAHDPVSLARMMDEAHALLA